MIGGNWVPVGRCLVLVGKLGHWGWECYQRWSLSLILSGTMVIAAVVDIVRQLNICPNNKAVMPIEANRFHVLKTLYVLWSYWKALSRCSPAQGGLAAWQSMWCVPQNKLLTGFSVSCGVFSPNSLPEEPQSTLISRSFQGSFAEDFVGSHCPGRGREVGTEKRGVLLTERETGGPKTHSHWGGRTWTDTTASYSLTFHVSLSLWEALEIPGSGCQLHTAVRDRVCGPGINHGGSGYFPLASLIIGG